MVYLSQLLHKAVSEGFQFQIIMAYKLEHVQGDHMAVLMETMHKWSNSQPDMYIISEEGHKIYTHKYDM